MKIRILVIVLFLFSIFTYAKTTITGKVTGTDGKPIPLAHVFLTYPSDDNPLKSVLVEKNGKYKIEIESEGLWTLHFTGIFHHEYTVALYCTTPENIKLDVKLETYKYLKKFDNVKVIGNFNDWAIYKGIPLNKERDGKYSVVIESKLDTVFYRFLNVRSGGKVEGTDADGYIPTGVDPEGTEGYNSFQVVKNGTAKIIFDPRKIIESKWRTSFKIFPENSFESKFAKAYATLEDTRANFKSILYSSLAERRFNFKFDFSSRIISVLGKLKKETNELIRQVLQLSYFELIYMSTISHHVDVETARQTLKAIPPNSVIWSLNPISISEAMGYASFTEPDKGKYVSMVVETNPMARTKEILLHSEIDRKFHSLQYKDIPPYLSILTDQYGNSPEAKNDKKIYAQYLKLKEGMNAPEFAINSLEDSLHLYTNKSFKGKYILLNFWSVANELSVGEFANLLEIHNMYGKNIDIISVSIDSSSAAVNNYINEKMQIPWKKGIAKKGFNSDLCRSYDVYSVPKSILIDPAGKVVSLGWDLLGKNMLGTINKYVAQ